MIARCENLQLIPPGKIKSTSASRHIKFDKKWVINKLFKGESPKVVYYNIDSSMFYKGMTYDFECYFAIFIASLIT